MNRPLPARSFWIALRARPLLALALLLGPLYLACIAAIPLDGTLEGNRLESAREMLSSGDWLVPRLGGAVYLAKPPLHPWTLALVSWPLGSVHLATGRIVSALAAFATCALVLAWGRRELGSRAGAFAALALGSSVALAQKAVRAELETELVLFTTLALLALWGAAQSPARGKRLALSVASGLALGAAVLVKGPPALIVFLAAALAAGSPRADRRAVLASAAVALLVALACALAWLVPVIARLGFETAWAAFHEQFVERLRHAGRTNAEPPWFYVPALLAALAPAVVFLPCLARVLPGRPRESERARARAAFLWGWAFLPVVLFSASSGKETRYLLPTLPAWSLLLAWGWVRARAAGGFLGWRRALARALAVATWAAPLVWIAVGTRAFPARVPVVVISGLAALLARAAFAWSARAEKPAALLGALALGVASAKLAWAGTALEKRRAEAPVHEVARAIASRLAPGEPWILVGPYRSWWDFAVDRPCVGVPEWDDLASGRPAGARYALVRAGLLPDRAPKIAGRWVIDGEPWCLVLIQT